MVTKTQLEFSYEPSNYFEVSLSLSVKHGHLDIENGKAVYLFTTPADPVPDVLLDDAEKETRMVFDLRALQVHRKYTLLPPSTIQYGKDGSVGRSISVSVNEMVTASDSPDVVVSDATGRVTHSSREERIRADKALIQALLSKGGSATLTSMLEGHRRAMDHPASELVHLYEVRDAATKHFGGDDAARRALRISDADWKELGRIANSAPLKQGRHGGKHVTGLRDATPEELVEVRRIARSIIEAFTKTLP